MPRVDADLKLDFKDVLLRPKRSSLKSRSEVGASGPGLLSLGLSAPLCLPSNPPSSFLSLPALFLSPGVTSQCPPRSKRPLRAGGVMVAGGCRRCGQERDGVAGPRRFFVEKNEKKMKEKGCRGCWGRGLLPTGASAGSRGGGEPRGAGLGPRSAVAG